MTKYEAIRLRRFDVQESFETHGRVFLTFDNEQRQRTVTNSQ